MIAGAPRARATLSLLVPGEDAIARAGAHKRTITYQSLRDMRELLAEMVRDVAGQAGVPVTSFRRVAWRRGFRDGE